MSSEPSIGLLRTALGGLRLTVSLICPECREWPKRNRHPQNDSLSAFTLKALRNGSNFVQPPRRKVSVLWPLGSCITFEIRQRKLSATNERSDHPTFTDARVFVEVRRTPKLRALTCGQICRGNRAHEFTRSECEQRLAEDAARCHNATGKYPHCC